MLVESTLVHVLKFLFDYLIRQNPIYFYFFKPDVLIFLPIFSYFLSLLCHVSFSTPILMSSIDLVQIISDQFMMFILSQ